MDWLELIPSFLSAIAAIAAAVAAFQAVKIGKRSAEIAKETALATNHSSAVLEYTKALKELQNTNDFVNAASDLKTYWPKTIDQYDTVDKSGDQYITRVRHIMNNACETLVEYSIERGKKHLIGQCIFSIVINGMGELSEEENKRVKKEESSDIQSGEYGHWKPSPSSDLRYSPIFRNYCYCLITRIKQEDWERTWSAAWEEDGWITHYQTEYMKIKPIFEKAYNTLQNEKNKLDHGIFPINKNPDLAQKYEKLLFALEVFIKDCSLDSLETYKKWYFKDERVQLILIAMATAELAMKQVDQLFILNE